MAKSIKDLLANLKKVASNIGTGVSNSMNDNKGLFQQGNFTPLKAVTNNWSSNSPVTQGLIKAQQFTQPAVSNIQAWSNPQVRQQFNQSVIQPKINQITGVQPKGFFPTVPPLQSQYTFKNKTVDKLSTFLGEGGRAIANIPSNAINSFVKNTIYNQDTKKVLPASKLRAENRLSKQSEDFYKSGLLKTPEAQKIRGTKEWKAISEYKFQEMFNDVQKFAIMVGKPNFANGGASSQDVLSKFSKFDKQNLNRELAIPGSQPPAISNVSPKGQIALPIPNVPIIPKQPSISTPETNNSFFGKPISDNELQIKSDIQKASQTNFKFSEGNKVQVDGKPYIISSSYVQDGESRYLVYPPGKKNVAAQKIWIHESDIASPKINTIKPTVSNVYTKENVKQLLDANPENNQLNNLYYGLRNFDGDVSNILSPQEKNLISKFSQSTPISTPQNKGINIKQEPTLKIKLKQSEVPQTKLLGQQGLQTNPLSSSEQPLLKLSRKSTPQNLLNPDTYSSSLSQPTLKIKKLVGRMQGSEKYPTELSSMLDGTYIPKNNIQTISDAKKLVKIDPIAAEKRAMNPQNAVDQAIGAELFNYHMDKGNVTKANEIINATSGTNEGQMIQILSQYDKTTPQGAIKFATNAVKSYNTTHPNKPLNLTDETIKSLYSDATKIQGMTEGRERNIASQQLINKVSNLIPSSFVDKAITVWKAGLLTSLRTHERNLIGNTIMNVSEIAKDPFASGADMLMSLKTGNRSMTSTLNGRLSGAKTGVQAMVDVQKLGFDPQESINKFDIQKVTWGNNPVEQFLKNVTDKLVFRPLAGEDKIFWHSSYAGSLYDQAGTAAINASKKGNKVFIENLVKNPTTEMKFIALNDADYATFHDKTGLSNIASGIKSAAKNIPGLGGEGGKIVTEMLAPFTGVPSSIVGKTLAYSPIGLVKGAINVGRVILSDIPNLQRQAAQEIGRGIIGTGLFGLGAYLMSKGLMTGQPKDANESALWAAQGKQSNSVLIGDKWRAIGSIGPQNLVMLAGAKYNQEMSPSGGGAGAYAMGLGQDQLNQTFLQGMMGPLNALTDPNRYGKSYLGNTVSSIVPNIIKDTSKAFDPTARELNTSGDYLKQSIPFLRNTLLPKRDNLGNIVPQAPTGVGAFFDLFNSKTPIDNAVVNEISRLYSTGNNALPSKLTPSQTIFKQKTKLTFEQLNNLEAGVGQALKPKLESLINDPNYKRLSDEEKASIIDKLVQDTRLKYKNVNANTLGVTPTGGYVDNSGDFKQIDNTPIVKPVLTGNKTIDNKLKLQYKNDLATQATNLAKSQQPIGMPIEQKVYSYVDENGAFKEVDLTPAQYPTMTGNTIVDKKLKSAYYSSINAQINGVIKLGQSGQITQDEMVKMVTALNTTYTKGKGGKKLTIGKIPKLTIKKMASLKFKKVSVPKLAFKMTSTKGKALSKFKTTKSKKLASLKFKKNKPLKLTLKAPRKPSALKVAMA